MKSSNLAPISKELEPDSAHQRRLDRSPHPYHRQSFDLPDRIYRTSSIPSQSSNGPITESHHQDDEAAEGTSPLPQNKRRLLASPSDSGTEADDERPLLRALTAPPLRPRKGLRNQKLSPSVSPLLTPSMLDDEPAPYNIDLDARRGSDLNTTIPDKPDDRLQKRRRHVIFRRLLETILLGAIGVLCFQAVEVDYFTELYLHTVVLGALYTFRLARGFVRLMLRQHGKGFIKSIDVPAIKDPAPHLYPLFIPLFVAVSIASPEPYIILANFVLSLAAIPRRVVPFQADTIQWALSLAPVFYGRWAHTIIGESEDITLGPKSKLEVATLLFPMHRALVPSLEYLTTTSLLSTEVQLMSIGLINLLLFAQTPQAVVVKALLWVGGLTIFVTCKDVLRWAVSLARVPNWRFRQVKHGIFKRSPVLRALDGILGGWLSSKLENSIRDAPSDSSEDDELPQLRKSSFKAKRKTSMDATLDVNPQRRISDYSPITPKARQRRNTMPAVPAGLSDLPQLKRTASIGLQKFRNRPRTFQALTSAQAFVLKWLYAAYTYLVIVFIILVPVRIYIGRYALNKYEPFGWAIGYLFGAFPSLRIRTVFWHLDQWIPLPAYDTSGTSLPEPAMIRLYIALHIFMTLIVGLVLVLHLAPLAEVDTRRKLFHGMMVTMFLPTIPIDPCFIALALSLALAVFLLLDLFRASQLPPLSRPLTLFLAPYVDGRDHRGPVIVSHIFLLIGCAVPLWLELAVTPRIGSGALEGWVVPWKGLGLISGVVCVGMGDAAASLVGRRFGRRRWPWGGGKSLEGSVAFAGAVVVGLMGAKLWILALAGWEGRIMKAKLMSTLGKATIAACGASFTEAVLTGANDNVLVPVVLWLLVRGLDV